MFRITNVNFKLSWSRTNFSLLLELEMVVSDCNYCDLLSVMQIWQVIRDITGSCRLTRSYRDMVLGPSTTPHYTNILSHLGYQLSFIYILVLYIGIGQTLYTAQYNISICFYQNKCIKNSTYVITLIFDHYKPFISFKEKN